MSKINVKKRRKKNSMHGWLICFALTTFFAFMGVGLAEFQSNVNIFGTMGTADCLVVFDGNPHIYGYSLVERDKGLKVNTDAQKQPAELISHSVSIITEANKKGSESSKDSKKIDPPNMKVISNDDICITVKIDNAFPGDVYKLQYTVVNKGTIPVVIDLGSISDNPYLKVENSLHPSEFLGPGESCDEELTITVGEDAEGNKNYSFSFQLAYRQWSAD